jgi:hypothetical protein
MRMKPTDKELEHDIIFQEIKKDHEKHGSINLSRVKTELEYKSVHLVNSVLESRRDAYLQYIKKNISRV